MPICFRGQWRIWFPTPSSTARTGRPSPSRRAPRKSTSPSRWPTTDTAFPRRIWGACEFGERLLAGRIGPLVEGAVEGADAEFGGEARGRFRYAALAECVRHGSGESAALEGGALLQFAVAGDDRAEPGAELAAVVREGGRDRV